jgi:hypothetical protein
LGTQNLLWKILPLGWRHTVSRDGWNTLGLPLMTRGGVATADDFGMLLFALRMGLTAKIMFFG